MFLRLAWRNLWRHPARTLILISAVALSYALMLVAFGIKDDIHTRMLRQAAAAAGGDVLIHGGEYWATRSSDIVVPDADAAIATISRVDGVRFVVPRVIVNGLASTVVDTRPIVLQGVHPESEARARHLTLDFGAGFQDDEGSAPLVLGTRLVDRLEAEPGDRIVLMGTTPEGEVTRALFHLTGILETGTREMDEVAAYTTLEAARRAFGLPGAVSQIGVMAEGAVDAAWLARRIEAALGAGHRLEVLTWHAAVPEMVALIEIDNALSYLFLGIIFAIALFSIVNVFLMAVLERVREIGLLNALGMRGVRLGRLMLAEAGLMTAVAMTLGLALGFAAHLAISRWGVNLAVYGLEELETAGIDISRLVIYSVISPGKWITGSVAIALATVAGALYPAWRASRLAPADAMRLYE